MTYNKVIKTKTYSVYVDGTEVNDYYMTKEEASLLALDFVESGYSETDISSYLKED